MKHKEERGFFDETERLSKLQSLKDPLIGILSIMDFEQFRDSLEKATLQGDYSKGGRPPFDRVMLFKCLILQKLYGLSDEQLEYQINDRLTFMRFLGLELSHRVPDAKTFWAFREKLVNKGVLDLIFNQFRDQLRNEGYIANEGKIIDATLVKAPVQRNSRKENDQIKQGGIPKEWSKNKKRQKDTDANWSKKNGEKHFGFKNHVKGDKKSKLIVEFDVTPSSVHDSQICVDLIDEYDVGQPIWADSAYCSQAISEGLKKKRVGNRIHKKGNRGRKLTSHEQGANKYKSRTRSRIEHIFASISARVNGMAVRCIGLERATADITMQNLVYNITRTVFLKKFQRINMP